MGNGLCLCLIFVSNFNHKELILFPDKRVNMEPTDKISIQILNLETLQDLLMTNDKSSVFDLHGIASLMNGIVEGLKEAHGEIIREC